jgi:AGCS family alanine or glycine:cation symporter
MPRVISLILIALLISLSSNLCLAQTPEPTASAFDNTPSNDKAQVGEVSLNERLAKQAWMKHVDQFFATYLVNPLATVLMFDITFGLLNSTNDDGKQTVVPVPFVVMWLMAAGIFLTIRMRFISIRGFWHGIQLIRGKYDDPSEPGEVTHFQALSSALSATVGLGNIGGVAIAVGLGGPGATFWMILMGFLGMSSKFSECSLALIYRSIDKDGRVLGGPMRYLKDGFTAMGLPHLGALLSVLFAILCIGASFGGGNAYQVGQSLGVLQQAEGLAFLNDYPYVYGIFMAAVVGMVIIGGIRWIGAMAGKIVPLMCVLYGAAAIYIVVTHIDRLPFSIYRIFTEAFNPVSAGVGSAIGVMIYGIRRAAFSNEAGIGSAAIAHSAAKTDEPISEGIVAIIEPFVDTILVCTLTALVIIITGVFETDAGRAFSVANDGAALTRLAFLEGGQPWFVYILYVSVFMFAYSTCISWSYYGERSFVYLFGDSSSIIYKILFLGFTVLGSIVSRGNILEFSDLMILAMAVPNLIGVYAMSNLIHKRLNEYWRRYQSGQLEPAVKYNKD